MPLHLKRGLPFELLQMKRNFFFLALLIKLTICDIFIIILFLPTNSSNAYRYPDFAKPSDSATPSGQAVVR